MSKSHPAPAADPEHWQLIQDLGGAAAVARALDKLMGTKRSGQSVSNWKNRGIPFAYRGPLVVMANQKGISTPKNFFNTDPRRS